MNPHDFSEWTAQAPPADFADRMVVEMQAAPRGVRGKRGWRWGGMLFLAAAFVGASAWATSGYTAKLEPAPEAPPPMEAPTLVVPVRPAPPMKVEAKAEPEAKPVQRWRPKAVPKVSAEPAPTPPPIVHQPRCECLPGVLMCACID